MQAAGEETVKTIESLTKNLLECYEELDLVYRLSRRLASNLDVQQNVELILREALEIFEADLGWVMPAEAGGGLFEPVMEGIAPETVALLQESVVVEVVAAAKPRTFDRLRDLDGLDRDGVPPRFLCTLLKTDATVYGVLAVGRWGEGEDEMFTAGDMKLSGALASQAAVALENFMLNQRRIEEQQAMIRMQEELRLAHEIQANLLPKEAPRLAGYEIAGSSLPARGVGGDYYDFIEVNPSRLAICLGDVSGKGMPAALLMANLQASVRGQTLMKATPGLCLSHSNTLLFHNTDAEKFATCFFGILDAEQHRLCYSNAGHDRPLLFSANGDHRDLDTGGLVLGVVPGVSFPEASVALEPGDRLVLYSDGITEAFDAAEEEFGVARMQQIIMDHRGAGAAEIMDAVLGAVVAHVGEAPVSDDRTLVVIARDG